MPSQKGVIGQWEQGSDYNRNSYKLNTSIPFRPKAIMWFIGGPFDSKGDTAKNPTLEIIVRAAAQWRKLDEGAFPLRVAGGEFLRVRSRKLWKRAGNRAEGHVVDDISARPAIPFRYAPLTCLEKRFL